MRLLLTFTKPTADVLQYLLWKTVQVQHPVNHQLMDEFIELWPQVQCLPACEHDHRTLNNKECRQVSYTAAES